MEHIQNELIVKYLCKELTEQESALVINWLNADPSNQDFLFGLEELYLASQFEDLKKLADTNNEWKKLESSILNTQSLKTSSKRIAIYRNVLKYAAVFALAISIPYLLQRVGFSFTPPKTIDTFATVVTQKGERSQLILPDGTKVWINAASSLTYNTNFSSKRMLKLSGEAYFEVAKDKDRPFVVETNLIQIKVLGTKFNLKAFDDEESVQATLYEGSISANTPGNELKQDVLLNPGQQFTYTKDKTMILASVDNTYDREWKDGINHFHKQTLKNIVHNLERAFNVNIKITDERLAQQIFTCEFKNAENLNDIMEILRMTGYISYSISGNQIIIKPIK